MSHCSTKRRLGDYTAALSDLEKLCEELILERTENHSEKLTRLLIKLLIERMTLQSITLQYSKAEVSFQASIAL